MTANTANTANNLREFTVPDLADHLHVSQRTIRVWIAEGAFPNAYQVGLGEKSHWRIPEADVLAFDQKRRRK